MEHSNLQQPDKNNRLTDIETYSSELAVRINELGVKIVETNGETVVETGQK